MQNDIKKISMLREIFFSNEIIPELEQIHSLKEYDYAQDNMKHWHDRLVKNLSKEELSLLDKYITSSGEFAEEQQFNSFVQGWLMCEKYYHV